MSVQNLYEFNTYFKLKAYGVEYLIDEPSTWDKISIENFRDTTFFGFNESFVNDKQQLEFGSDKKAPYGTRNYAVAYDVIKKLYDTYGADGQIVLEFGYITGSQFKVLYSANLNLYTYNNQEGIIKCSVEKLNFNDLFRTRYDTNINLSLPATIDGDTMEIPALDVVKLRSKLISKQYVATVTTPEIADGGSHGLARFLSIQPDFSNEVITELGESEGLPLGVTGIDPRDEQRYFFKVLEAGNYIFDFKTSFDLRILGPFDGIGNWFVEPRFMIQRPNTAKVTVNLSAGQISGSSIIGTVLTGGGAGYTYANVTFTGDGTGASAIAAIAGGVIVSITMTNGGFGYTFAGVVITGDGAGATATVSNGSVTGLTIVNPGDGYTAAFVTITGDGTGATATLTLTAGKVTGYAITDGGLGFTNATAVVTGDASIGTFEYTLHDEFKQSGNTVGHDPLTLSFNVPLKFTRTLEVGDLLYYDFVGIMEHAGATYWYNVTNYTSNFIVTGQTSAADSTARAYRLYDAIKILLNATTGQADNLRSSVLSEGGRAYNYHITNGYQIRNFDISFKPINTSLKNAIESACAIFALGYGFKTITNEDGSKTQFLIIEDVDFFFKDIEIMRLPNANNYYEEHAKDMCFNQGVFGYEKYPSLSTANGSGNTLDEFNTFHNYQFPLKFIQNVFTKKAAYCASGYAAEVQRREQFKDNPSQSLSDDDTIFIIATETVEDVLQNETNENFDTVTGVLSPETAYDLRITPTRMLFNWSKYLAIGFDKKDPASNIILTLAQNNNTLVSQLKATDPYNKFEPEVPVSEGGTYTLAQFTGSKRKAIHTPQYSFFKSEMDFNTINDLLDHLSFNTGDDRDGGWVSYPDDKGNIWKGFVYDVKYDPHLCEATFQIGKIGPY